VKTEIIERLGQTDLLLPSLVAEGLAANDRVKARLSVLQAAGGRARDPTGVRFDLTDECRAAGIDPVPLETVVNCARLSAGKRITAPGLASLGDRPAIEAFMRGVEATQKLLAGLGAFAKARRRLSGRNLPAGLAE
jgi:hypothetical protein